MCPTVCLDDCKFSSLQNSSLLSFLSPRAAYTFWVTRTQKSIKLCPNHSFPTFALFSQLLNPFLGRWPLGSPLCLSHYHDPNSAWRQTGFLGRKASGGNCSGHPDRDSASSPLRMCPPNDGLGPSQESQMSVIVAKQKHTLCLQSSRNFLKNNF